MLSFLAKEIFIADIAILAEESQKKPDARYET